MNAEVEATTTTTPEPKGNSKLLSVSVRGWIALIVVGTMCIMWANGLTVPPELYVMGSAIVFSYYGQGRKEGQS